MYDYNAILAYNNDPESFKTIRSVVKHVRAQPIEFTQQLKQTGIEKCAIHIPVWTDDTGAGCGLVPVGRHPSIRALYDGNDGIVCHVGEGARVIDAEFAQRAYRLDDEYVTVALNDDPVFTKRYFGGSHTDWPYYGRGYCYLSLIRAEARNRVARILGPFPLVYDVMRFVILAGYWGVDGLFLRKLADNVYHVEVRPWTYKTSMRNILRFAVTLPSSARVGGDPGDGSSGYALSNLFRDAGYNLRFPPVDALSDWIKIVPNERLERLRVWMDDMGVVPSASLVAYLLVATTVASTTVLSRDVKQSVKFWQLWGDIVAKQYALAQVMDSAGTSESYSNIVSKLQSNASMAKTIVGSTFSTICDCSGLPLDSKSWADIVEAVVGLVSLTQSAIVLRKVMVYFELLPNSCDETITVTKEQAQIVKSLIRSGKL